MTNTPNVLALWDSRAALGPLAGTQDRHAVALEQRIILTHVKPGMRILDVGCGLGDTLALCQCQEGVDLVGVDFSPAMIEAARATHPGLRFDVVDLLGPWPADLKGFDLVYTERCLINLPDWPAQAAAIQRLLGLVKRGGSLLAVENSQTGLDALNGVRTAIGLPAIVRPWHNRYLVDGEVHRLRTGCHLVDDAVDYSSSYYFVSRVVNAWQAQQDGREPAYDAPMNRMALQLPVIGKMGQGRYWRWVKA